MNNYPDDKGKREATEENDTTESSTMSSMTKTAINNMMGNERREKVKQGFQKFGSKLQKLNLGRLIDQMEQDQGLADSLEQLNEQMQEEMERRDIQREAEQACMQTMVDHLNEFLQQKPDGTYEEWIQDLHPENVHDGKLLSDLDKEVDLRFYVEESDHRLLWNERHQNMPLRLIPARNRMWDDNHSNPPVDLLDSATATAGTATSDASLLSSSGGDNKKDEADLISF